MIDFVTSDPVDLGPGDQIETVTAIRRGSVVGFERVEPHRVLLRALSPEEQRAYAGPMYRIDKSETPGQLTLKQVGGAR